MADIALKRIRRDVREIIESEEVQQCGIKVQFNNDSFFELRGEIPGPPDTPYEGGKFVLEINIPSNYPFEPPGVRFVTKIWHTNVSISSGFIYLEQLSLQWSASMTLKSILMSIQNMLSAPEPDEDDTTSIAAAKQLQCSPKMFKLTARHWTNVYAGGSIKVQSCDEKIKKLMKFGLNENDSRIILSSYDWDLDYAIHNESVDSW